MKIYVAGALANPEIVRVTKVLMDAGHEAFSEWFTPGPDADTNWRTYEQALGLTYREALKRPAAQHIFNFDKRYIDESDAMLLVYPAGKSAHLELGYTIGQGKPGYVLMAEEPERWDVMLAFATDIVSSVDEFLKLLDPKPPQREFVVCVDANSPLPIANILKGRVYEVFRRDKDHIKVHGCPITWRSERFRDLGPNEVVLETGDRLELAWQAPDGRIYTEDGRLAIGRIAATGKPT